MSPRTFGDAPFSVSATATSALTVSFASQTTSVCTVSGTTVTIVAAGQCTITASQGGNNAWLAATDVSQSFTVNPAPQSITFGVLGGKLYGAAPFGVSATATSMLPVAFASMTAPVCTVSGTTVTILSAGVCTIEATQLGNTNWQAATPVNRSFIVGYAVSLAPSAKLTFKSGSALPVKFQLNDANGNPIPAALAASLGCAIKVTFSTDSPACAGYDPVAKVFQVDIKTSKSLAAGSYPIVISLTVGPSTFVLATFSVVAK